MIYLVTKQTELVPSNDYEIISVEKSLELLEQLQEPGLDTETSGLDPYTCELLMVQLGCFDFQVVIDCRTINIQLYKDYLQSKRRFLGWTLKFDLKFLFRQGIYPRTVYDGFLAEKLLWQGYPPGMHSMSLKSAGITYLGVELDKSVRGKIIWSKTLSTDIIVYGAHDVKYLNLIKEKQEEELAKKGLLKAVDLENRFVFPLSYCEFCGVKLDEAKWKAKMVKDNEKERLAKEACNKWLLENEPNNQYITINRQGDLFAAKAFDLSPKVTINWNSTKQIAPIFKKYGVDIIVDDKETLDAKQLRPQADKCSLIPIYLKYKEAVKVTSTYGQNFLDQINPVSHRIHTNYGQLGADTTRITSGGKDKGSGVSYVNLLNLPKDSETRACFVSEPGNKWISIDYSSQETYLMASIANDEAIINELTYGSGDIHSLTAYMSFHDIPRETAVKDIKKLYPEHRQNAKSIEFAINYGGNARTIQQNSGISEEEANKVYDAYMSGFKGLKRYQDFRRRDWLDKGYILLNPRDGHKLFIWNYDELMKTKEWMRTLDWDYYRLMKKEDPKCDTVRRVRDYFHQKSEYDKMSINYPIQGAGSMCLRYSLIFFFYWMRDNDLLGKVKICITPYDEINLEAPEAIAEEVAAKIHECMVKGGSYFCTRCKLDADMSRLPDGSLPNYWIHY